MVTRSCPGCHGYTFMSRLSWLHVHIQVVMVTRSCPGCHGYTFMSWLSWLHVHVQVVMVTRSYTGCHGYTFMSRLSWLHVHVHMYNHVSFEVTFPIESFATHCTDERFLTCVNHHMSLKITLRVESLHTMLTVVFLDVVIIEIPICGFWNEQLGNVYALFRLFLFILNIKLHGTLLFRTSLHWRGYVYIF